MNLTFKTGSRGFLVRRLQTAFRISADGIYGAQTRAAVAGLQMRLQREGIPVSAAGEAGPAEFKAAGLFWPPDFERAMNLVSCFEGTSFGDCNRRDIDGAGLTLGIAGYTTAHGEVQELLARYISERPSCVDVLPTGLQVGLAAAMNRKASAAQWKQLFYGADGNVLAAWVTAFAQWGACTVMQNLQLGMAHQRFWKRAVDAARSHGFSTLHAYVFFLDVAVQNGGWRKAHLAKARAMSDWFSGEPEKALTVAARAVASCAKDEWKNDVLSRKMTIATGAGMVHGRQWKLRDFALL